MNLLLSNKLTTKQRKWLKEYKRTLNATEAAMLAYDCKDRDSANTIGNENLAKLGLKNILETIGLSDEAVAKGIFDGATKSVRPVVVKGEVRGFPDYGVRHRYWETTLKLKGELQDTSRVELTGKDGDPIQIQAIVGLGFLNKPKEKEGD